MIDASYINAVYGVIGSLIGTAVGYGILKQKVDHLFQERSEFVKKEVFQATLQPIQEDLSTVTTDVKEILRRVGGFKSCQKCSNYREG